jgi:hydrogenase maturation factor
MCLGEYGTVAEVVDVGRASVRFASGTRGVSLAVLAADGTVVTAGDVVMVSMGMALRVVDEQLVDDTTVDLSVRIDQEVIA